MSLVWYRQGREAVLAALRRGERPDLATTMAMEYKYIVGARGRYYTDCDGALWMGSELGIYTEHLGPRRRVKT